MSDTAWYNDVTVLARRPDEFWPSRRQNDQERLNSLVRLVAYTALAIYLYRHDLKFLSFGLGAVSFLSLVHRFGAPREGCCLPGRPPVPSRPPPGGGAARRSPAARRDGFSTEACTRSTPDNPFANVLLSDLATNPGRPPACTYDAHKDDIAKNFNKGLVRNVYDVYDRENSQRQFMTMPVTTSTPDTTAFVRFAYGSAGRATCKEDPSRCMGSFP